MRKQSLVLIGLVLFLVVELFLMPPAQSTNTSEGDGWPMFRGNPIHSGFIGSKDSTNSAQLLWNYSTGGAVWSSPAVAHGYVVAGSMDKSVYCLNASNGQLIWSLPTGEQVDCSPTIYNNRVYVGSDDGWLYCINLTSGVPLWIEWVGWNMGWSSRPNPVVADDRVYVGSGNHDLVCFNASDGSTIWRYSTEYPVMTTPALANDTLYFATDDYFVYAVNASTGEELWRTVTRTVNSSPAVQDGCVYVGSTEGFVYAINASTGELMWGFKTNDAIVSSPAAAYGCIYVGSQDSSVYCINASNGHKVWEAQTGYWVVSSPAIADGNVYVGSQDYNIYCLNASTGEKKWTYTTGNHVDSSPAIANDVLYVGSYDGNIYALALYNSTSQNVVADVAIAVAWSTVVFDAITCLAAAIIVFTAIRFYRLKRQENKNDPAATISAPFFRRHLDTICVLAILAASLLLYINLGNSYLWPADEQTYSQMAVHMLKTGDYLTPYANGVSALWTGKPPLLMWLMSLSYQAFGITNFAARFWMPIFGALSLVLVFFLGKKLYNRTVGLLAVAVLGTFSTFYLFATHAMIDILLLCLGLASLYFFVLAEDDGKGAVWLAALGGVCFGLAFLTKLTGALLIPVILVVYLFAAKRSLRAVLSKRLAVFVLAGLLVAMPWLVYMTTVHGYDFWNSYFLYSTFARAANPIEGHGQSYLYYFNYLATSENLLWVALLPFAVGFSGYLAVKRSKADVLVVSWIAIILLVFTLAQTKIYYYILPAYPAFALAISNLLSQSGSWVRKRLRRE